MASHSPSNTMTRYASLGIVDSEKTPVERQTTTTGAKNTVLKSPKYPKKRPMCASASSPGIFFRMMTWGEELCQDIEGGQVGILVA